MIDGIDTAAFFASAAPGWVVGILQIVVGVPDDTPSGQSYLLV
jgi:hypothetical protein